MPTKQLGLEATAGVGVQGDPTGVVCFAKHLKVMLDFETQ